MDRYSKRLEDEVAKNGGERKKKKKLARLKRKQATKST
jgi:hypothetical protein